MPKGRDTSKDPRRVVRDENIYWVNFRNPQKFHPVVQDYYKDRQKNKSRNDHPSNTKPYNWQEDMED